MKKHSIFLNGFEVLRATKDNNKKTYYKVCDGVLKKTTKKEFMQTLEKLHNLNLVNEQDYLKVKLYFF